MWEHIRTFNRAFNWLCSTGVLSGLGTAEEVLGFSAVTGASQTLCVGVNPPSKASTASCYEPSSILQSHPAVLSGCSHPWNKLMVRRGAADGEMSRAGGEEAPADEDGITAWDEHMLRTAAQAIPSFPHQNQCWQSAGARQGSYTPSSGGRAFGLK